MSWDIIKKKKRTNHKTKHTKSILNFRAPDCSNNWQEMHWFQCNNKRFEEIFGKYEHRKNHIKANGIVCVLREAVKLIVIRHLLVGFTK